jgi:hypothetical protein
MSDTNPSARDAIEALDLLEFQFNLDDSFNYAIVRRFVESMLKTQELPRKPFDPKGAVGSIEAVAQTWFEHDLESLALKLQWHNAPENTKKIYRDAVREAQ